MLQGDLDYLSDEHPQRLQLLQLLMNDKKRRRAEEYMQNTERAVKCLHLSNHNMEHAFALPFFFFCFGG